jgi:hypothetical protein
VKRVGQSQLAITYFFLNNIGDRVVSADHIIKMSKRLRNSQIVNFIDSEHEIFMEKDDLRKKMWKNIDTFLKD